MREREGDREREGGAERDREKMGESKGERARKRNTEKREKKGGLDRDREVGEGERER